MQTTPGKPDVDWLSGRRSVYDSTLVIVNRAGNKISGRLSLINQAGTNKFTDFLCVIGHIDL